MCTPGSMPSFSACIVPVERVRFFKLACPSKRKYHITLGHTTVLATVHFFSPANPDAQTAVEGATFDFDREYLSKDELLQVMILAPHAGPTDTQ